MCTRVSGDSPDMPDNIMTRNLAVAGIPSILWVSEGNTLWLEQSLISTLFDLAK